LIKNVWLNFKQIGVNNFFKFTVLFNHFQALIKIISDSTINQIVKKKYLAITISISVIQKN